jgi:hypothetical protein
MPEKGIRSQIFKQEDNRAALPRMATPLFIALIDLRSQDRIRSIEAAPKSLRPFDALQLTT